MNTFYEHHKHNIVFQYQCFDRILLNACIQPFYQPERVKGFFDTCRNVYPVTPATLGDIARQYRNWVINRSKAWRVPILDAPRGRRDDFVDRYFKRAKPDQVVVILKAREPAQIVVSIGSKKTKGYHLQLSYRWVDQYSFYIHDRDFGRMFIRVCPYFPFSARIYFNQHYWLAIRMKQLGIRFQQCANAFLRCSDPDTLEQLGDSWTAQELMRCAQKWLRQLIFFFRESERRRGCQHRLFFSQVEYADNLIFRRRACLDRLGQRLLDANREIGQPDKLTLIFGRRISRRHAGKLQTCIEDMHLPNPVIRSHYKNGFIKQYVRDNRLLRTEATTNNVRDYGKAKAVENLAAIRETMKQITQNYLNVQQDILTSYIDRGHLQSLSQPTVASNGKRIPGLRLDRPRQLALMQALVRFQNLAAQATFSTSELHPHILRTLGSSPDQFSLPSLRYELWKLRSKSLVDKLPHSNRYRLTPEGYRLCVVYLKLFHRIYAPLTSAIMEPYAHDADQPSHQLTELDGLYRGVDEALHRLLVAVGLQVAA